MEKTANHSLNQPTVSVIIPAHNSEKLIAKCLKSVVDAIPENKEIIVIDDGSTDNTSEIASKFPVKLIRLAKRSGQATAKNVGFELSTGEIVVFVDSDTIVTKHFFVELASALSRDQVGGAGGLVLPIKSDIISSSFMVRLFGYSPISEKENIEIDSTPGGCSAYHRKVLTEIGGFDTNLKQGEELDMNIRIRKAGYKLLIVPSAKIYHDHPTTLQKLAKKWFFYGVWYFFVCRKHSLNKVIIQISGWASSCFLILFTLLLTRELLFLPLLAFTFWVPWALYYGKSTLKYWAHMKKVKYLALPLIHQTIILSRTLGFLCAIFMRTNSRKHHHHQELILTETRNEDHARPQFLSTLARVIGFR
jgi:glycosyltransferase involved in cell wall biosynthesis